MTAGDACDAAYQGEPGAYSEQAAWILIGGDARLLPCRSLPTMFDAVGEGRARHAVLPIENTLAGTVPGAYELLLERGFVASGETRVQIDHVLIGRVGATASQIRRVLSHPVALDQCRRFLTARPDIEPVAVFDTAGAVSMALEDGSAQTAAIASRRAASLHGGVILAEQIQNHPENLTRFLLLTSARTVARDRVGHAIVAFKLPHQVGALARVLDAVAAASANLTKIESRPIEGRPFEYAFFVEFDLDVERSALIEVMNDLEKGTIDLRLLGAYQKHGLERACTS